MAGNILVAVFSASGVTKRVGEEIARIAGADFYEIVPKELYTSEDLNWMNKKSRSSVEMQDPSSRVPIADKVEDMDRYDTLYVGFPIWWYVAPHIINSFLEQYDLSGKTIHLFATSGGSGMGETVAQLKGSAPGAVWGKADRLSANASLEKVAQWIGL